MARKRWYFWNSQKQRKVIDRMDARNYGKVGRNSVIINGERVEYTEASSKSKPCGNWDDYNYLGSLSEAQYNKTHQYTSWEA